MKIPLLDLHLQNDPLKAEIDKALEGVWLHQRFILGPEVKELEQELAKYCGVPYAAGVASGSDALYLSLLAAGVGPGDEVITTPFTFFATAGAIERAGAIPIFVDIDPKTFNINPDEIEKVVSTSTKAIIPVHLFGLMCDMDKIKHIAKKHDLIVIEDAAQAIGAEYKGKRAGSIGDLGCFSFFPSKNLGCLGDGGLVTTTSEHLDNHLKSLRVHGATERYYHRMVGINSRLDTVQAAVLLVKLKYLESWHKARQENADYYSSSISNPLITIPIIPEGYRHIFNQYTIRVKDRDRLISIFKQEDIGSCIYYPLPLHLQPCFHEFEYLEGDLKEAELASKEALSIPIFPGLKKEEQDFIINILNSFS